MIILDNTALELPLRDIHLPNPISWWPLAPGWWLLLVMAILLCGLTVWLIRMLLRPTLRKQAIQQLDYIEKSFEESEDAVQCLTELSALLRRAVLSQNHSKAAGLIGTPWLKVLDEPLKSSEFSQGVGQLLLNGPYQSQVEKKEVFQLIQLCRKWVKCL